MPNTLSRELALELTVEPRHEAEVVNVFCGFIESIEPNHDNHHPESTHEVFWDKYGVEHTWVQIPHLPIVDWRNEEETEASLLEFWGNGTRQCTPVYVDSAREAVAGLIEFQRVDSTIQKKRRLAASAMFVGGDAVLEAFSRISEEPLGVDPRSQRLRALYNAMVLAVNRVSRQARGADASSWQHHNMQERLRRDKELLRPGLSIADRSLFEVLKRDAIQGLEDGVRLEHPLVFDLTHPAKKTPR